MTSREWVIYNKGYTKGLDVGEAVTEERIIKLLEGDEGQKIMCLECSNELIALIERENK